LPPGVWARRSDDEGIGEQLEVVPRAPGILGAPVALQQPTIEVAGLWVDPRLCCGPLQLVRDPLQRALGGVLAAADGADELHDLRAAPGFQEGEATEDDEEQNGLLHAFLLAWCASIVRGGQGPRGNQDR